MEEGGGGAFLGVFAVEGRETRILLLLGHGAEGNEFGGGVGGGGGGLQRVSGLSGVRFLGGGGGQS